MLYIISAPAKYVYLPFDAGYFFFFTRRLHADDINLQRLRVYSQYAHDTQALCHCAHTRQVDYQGASLVTGNDLCLPFLE